MINTIEDLEKVLKLLRKQGVETFKFEMLEIKLGELPQEPMTTADQALEQLIPSQSALDLVVGMPVSGLDDPFLTYSVHEQRELSEDQ